MESIDHDSYHRMEQIFVEGYRSALDKLLFLRLARVPFAIDSHQEGQPTAYLKQIVIQEVSEVGHVVPAFGKEQLVHQMFPHELVKTNYKLSFIYVNLAGEHRLGLNEVLSLQVDHHDHHH